MGKVRLKQPMLFGTVWNFKSCLIDHHSLSGVSIIIRHMGKKLFESYNSVITVIHFFMLRAVFWHWVHTTDIIINQSLSQTGNDS